MLSLLLTIGGYSVARSGDIQPGKELLERSATFYVH